MTISKIRINYKGTDYIFEIDRKDNGELSLVSPVTGELIKVPGISLREKYETVARQHLKQWIR